MLRVVACHVMCWNQNISGKAIFAVNPSFHSRHTMLFTRMLRTLHVRKGSWCRVEWVGSHRCSNGTGRQIGGESWTNGPGGQSLTDKWQSLQLHARRSNSEMGFKRTTDMQWSEVELFLARRWRHRLQGFGGRHPQAKTMGLISRLERPPKI